MDKSEIESMSFDDKLAKLQAGIVIPPPDRIDRKLDAEKVFDAAILYSTRSAFLKGNKAAYHWAWRRGLLDEMCQHMEPAKRGRKS